MSTLSVLVTLPSGNQAIYDAPPQRPGEFVGPERREHAGSTDEWIIEHGRQVAHERNGRWFKPGGWQQVSDEAVAAIKHAFPEARTARRTHDEQIARVRPARPCSAHDVLAGGQCGNCLWVPA